MAYQPDMPGEPRTNVYKEDRFCVHGVFAASSVVTSDGKDASLAKTTTTTFTVTLPKPYKRITSIGSFWYKPSGAAPLTFQLTDKSDLSVGGTLVFTTCATNTAGTPTAPAAGDEVWIEIGLSDDVLNSTFWA